MMTIAELAQMGQALIEQAAAEKAFREAQEDADREERRLVKLLELRDALQVDDAVWNSLNARVIDTVHEVKLAITLFGYTYYPYNDLRGWRHDTTLGPVNAQTLAVVARQAQLARAQNKESVLHILETGGGYHNWRDYDQAQKIAVFFDGLWDEPDVQAARRAFLERYRPQTLNDLPADDPWFDTWIADSEKLGLDATGVVSLRIQVRDYDALLSEIAVKELQDDGSTAAAQELYDWIAQLPTERQMPGLGEGVQYRTRRSEARARLDTRMRGEQHRQRVAELETAAFYPFRYFRVYYGIMVVRYTEEYDDQLIEEQSQEALTYPTPSGEYIDAHGKLIRALHISRIETVNVRTLADMPWFAPHPEAEDGVLYRVPPVQCERLTEKDAGSKARRCRLRRGWMRNTTAISASKILSCRWVCCS